MASATAVPSSSCRQHTPWSVVNSRMKLRGCLQFTGTKANGHFKGHGSCGWHFHITWITLPCQRYKSRDLNISSWRLLLVFLLLAGNVLRQWWTQGLNWVVAFSLLVPTEMAILKVWFTWLTPPRDVDNTPMSHAQIMWSKDVIMASASVVPSSSSRKRTSLSVANSGMKLKGSLQFTGTNSNGHFKGRGSRDWHAHITWITLPCHMHKSRDLKISSWRLLVLFLLLADNVLHCQWWAQGWN